MQNIKSMKFGWILKIIKCALIGIIATLIGTVIFAAVLKFANLSSKIIPHINNIIKVFSIFIMLMCVRREGNEKLLIKSVLAGMFYAIFSFIIFSILNGRFDFNLSVLYDLLFALIVSVVSTIIMNLLSHKNM